MRILPWPKHLSKTGGRLSLPARSITVSCPSITEAQLKHLKPAFPELELSSSGTADITFRHDSRLRPESYALSVTEKGIIIRFGDPAGAYYAIQTLKQIRQQCPRHLPCLEIRDSPSLTIRGAYLDITRGRVPKLATLKHIIRRLSEFKINHIQLYMEHVFTFASHPEIGRGASPMSPDDLRELDAFCRDHHVELAPSIASFGHMNKVLSLPSFRHLAEDYGVGRYSEPGFTLEKRYKGWTLSPSAKGSYRFIEELYRDLLPCFSSPRVNVCCDEVYDLGKGQSYARCLKQGRETVYTDHVLRLRRIAAKQNKTIQIWSDCIREYPRELDRLPHDVTLLDWGYEHFVDFDRLNRFSKRGLTHWACPGTSSWVSLFPRLHEARANIDGYVEAAMKYGSEGLLCTDWGDGGHHNFQELSWHGLVYAASRSWNASADPKGFTLSFIQSMFGVADRELASALDELGRITHLECAGRYQSIWFHLYFARVDDGLWARPKEPAWMVGRRGIHKKHIHMNAAFGHETHEQVSAIEKVFKKTQGKVTDPDGVLPYWRFAADTLDHTARRLIVLAEDGRRSRQKLAALGLDMADLHARYEGLWLARNRPSELRITRRKYRDVIKSLAAG
jgi:hypothetical protein